MSAADQLRQAADAIREHALAATPGPWRVANQDGSLATVNGADVPRDSGRVDAGRPFVVIPEDCDYGPTVDIADAAHIAGMHPGVALAVSRLLANIADLVDIDPDWYPGIALYALDVARLASEATS